MTVLALAWPDTVRGGLCYLKRDSFLGNLMPTSDPLLAESWGDEHGVMVWFGRLTAGQKAQLEGRELLIVPVTAAVGEPVSRFVVEEVREVDEVREGPTSAPHRPAPPKEPEFTARVEPKGQRLARGKKHAQAPTLLRERGPDA
jgi:hypothetical protein